jgi:hypothetical protein
VCFDGVIDAESAARFGAALGSVDQSPALTVIVRSGGGEVDAGMSMGRAILKRRADVRVEDMCLSSCANYLLSAGRTKTVPLGAIIAFHGGVRPLSPDEVKAEAALEKKEFSDDEAKGISAKLLLSYKNQIKFSTEVRVNPDFFAWMERFNALSDSRKSKICQGFGGDTEFFVFSPELLAAKGYRLDSYGGPRSERALRRTLLRDGWPADDACFIEKSAGRF